MDVFLARRLQGTADKLKIHIKRKELKMIQAYYQATANSKLVTLTDLEEIEDAFQRAAGQTNPHCKVWITLEAAT